MPPGTSTFHPDSLASFHVTAIRRHLFEWLRFPGESTPHNCAHLGRPRLKGATFFRLQVYEWVGILLIKVYERVGKSVISVCKNSSKG